MLIIIMFLVCIAGTLFTYFGIALVTKQMLEYNRGGAVCRVFKKGIETSGVGCVRPRQGLVIFIRAYN